MIDPFFRSIFLSDIATEFLNNILPVRDAPFI